MFNYLYNNQYPLRPKSHCFRLYKDNTNKMFILSICGFKIPFFLIIWPKKKRNGVSFLDKEQDFRNMSESFPFE